jgi:glycosyltransferase involved in cell wall biosynthesis
MLRQPAAGAVRAGWHRMTTSILLPTRNRLEFLKYAVETVLRQDSPDWELVVSDNDSSEDIGGYLATLKDARIIYHRTERFLPVTDNWNAALERSSGDYVVMLGDDDGLMPGCISSLERLVERFRSPDVVYNSALLLTYPSVLDEHPEGYLMPYGYASFLRDAQAPFVLGHDLARRMVEAAMDFRLTYGYNAQFVAISRRLIDELAPQGPFYQSPFPDYYSTNVAFLKARSIVVEPNPQVLIGVTPRSYGFYYTNQRDDEGRAFLAGETTASVDPELEHVLLPGNNINIGWLLSMEAIRRNYGAEFGLKVNRRRFRFLQAAHVYEQHYLRGTVTDEQLAELETRLRPRERRLYRLAARTARASTSIVPPRIRRASDYAYRRSLRQFPTWNPPHIEGQYANVLEAYDHYAQTPPPAS